VNRREVEVFEVLPAEWRTRPILAEHFSSTQTLRYADHMLFGSLLLSCRDESSLSK
jgi:hypothetical protein